MFKKKRIKMPFIFIAFFVIITFTIPVAVLAGPPDGEAKCPCFSEREVLRAISKSSQDVLWNNIVNNDGNGQYQIQIFYGSDFDGFKAYHWDDVGTAYDVFFCTDMYQTSKGKNGRCVEQTLNITEEEAAACMNILKAISLGCVDTINCGGGTAYWTSCQ